jgi:GT2 family glycosyltransferase/glycosyltransferase involved in cell wall biosynthesis
MRTGGRLNMLDIIIVNFNSTGYLLPCLRSIYDSLRDFSAKIFVQDNSSEDSVDLVNVEFPQVVLSKNSYNMGFSKAINNALKQSDSPYIALLNPDTYVTGNFFEPILGYMEGNSEVGIVGPQILDRDGSVQGSARAFPTPLTGLFGRSSLLTRFFPNNRLTRENILTTRSDGKTPMEVHWVSGACMVVRRKAVDDVGLMDERFFLYWEDADWCKRMWDGGWKVIYFPLASLVHYVGVSSTQGLIRATVEFHKSSYRLFDKYSKPPLRFLSPLVTAGLSVRLCYALVSSGMRVLCRRHKSFLSWEQEGRALERKRKIKVLRIIARLNIGGPAIHVHLLTRGLDMRRFEPTLVAGKISPKEGDMGYLFDSMDKKPIIIPELQREIGVSMDLKAFRQILGMLLREKPDIVHTHTAKAGSSARLAVLLYNLICKKGVRTVHTFHGHVFDGYFSKSKSLLFIWIERFLAGLTDAIIAISETQRKDLSEKYHVAPVRKINTIKLGFDLKPFLRSEALKGQFRQSLGINDGSLLIGVVGRLVPIKNHKMFFQAARIFLEQNPGVRAKFVVVGDGELRGELETYCQHVGLTNHVVFCSWVKNVPVVYADLDILALTSKNEGTPVSIIEAMAASVPVIATDAGGVLDLLGLPEGVPSSDGFVVCERGILCRKSDALGFAEGLKYLTEVDAEEKRKRLLRARYFVGGRFSEKRLLQDIESLYLELMANRRKVQ